MHSRFLIIIWRRKLSILLLTSVLFLIGLWSWAFYNTAYTAENKDKVLSIKEFESGAKHEYLLQKLISQANSVIQHQRQQREGNPDSATNGVKFIKPTRIGLQPQSSSSKYKAESYLFEGERLRMLQNQQKSLREDVVEKKPISSAERQSQYERDLQRMGIPIIAGIGPGGPQPPGQRLVHLDLKGAPPKLSFLKRLLPILKTLGATGLLIEYEDMFPYLNSIGAISATNAYKREELKDFLQSVARHGLTIIPLVQTFGHLEYALKLQGFEHMRENPDSPQSICPSQKVSMTFIEDMITQIVEFHLQLTTTATAGNNSSSSASSSSTSTTAGKSGTSSSSSSSSDGILPNFTHIHIGCDEVYRMGECPKCMLKPRNELFLNHVSTIASFVRAKWPNIKVLIWDDMLRDMTLSDMQNSQIGTFVEPMIWVYANDIYRFIQPHLWDKYSKVFPTAWAASAFKGAFGESLMITPIQKHLENNLRWLAVIAKEGGRFSKGFQGIALTGWQRYDHFAVLCELLPTGMPSLMTSLSTVSKGYFSVDAKNNAILNILECPNRPDNRRSGRPWVEFHTTHHSNIFTVCKYPGSSVYKHILVLNEKLTETRNYLNNAKTKSAWMSEYNIRHNFSSPNRVREITSNTPKFIDDLTSLAKETNRVMSEIYDEHTIREFVEQNILPLIGELRNHEDNGRALISRNTWPKRPLPYDRGITQLELVPRTTDVNDN